MVDRALILFIWIARILVVALTFGFYGFMVRMIARDVYGCDGEARNAPRPFRLRMEAGDRIRYKPAGEAAVLEARPGDSFMFPTGEELVYIGRGQDNQIIVDDPFVSSRHAVIFRRSGRLWLRDLASSNRTFVNGKPVDTIALRAGDSIGFGDTVCTLYE